MLLIDGCDDAIIGFCDTPKGPVAVYNYELLVQVFERMYRGKLDDPHEAAVEWVEYNIVGAYLGDGTPLIVYPATRAELDERADDDEST